MDTIRAETRGFVVENFLFGEDNNQLTDQESFLEGGIIDSTGVLELVAFLERRYEIVIADHELVPNNLDSIEQLVRFVSTKLESKDAGIAG